MIKILTVGRTAKRFLNHVAGQPVRKIAVYMEISRREEGHASGPAADAEAAPNYGLCGEGAYGGMVFAHLALWHGVDETLPSASDPVLHACDVLLSERREVLEKALQGMGARSVKAETFHSANPNTPNAGERQG